MEWESDFSNSFLSDQSIVNELYQLPSTSRIIQKINGDSDLVVCEDSSVIVDSKMKTRSNMKPIFR